MKQVYFITGTDTGVGKSRVAAGLLHAARAAGMTTAALKPVASGCEDVPGQGLRNEDALLLQQACHPAMAYEQINPVALQEAVAPHIAAVNAGRKLSLERLAGFCRGVMMQRRDFTVIEGAGGWRVPLNSRETLAGLPKLLETPVILVVGIRLGGINHALLSAEAIQMDGLSLAGWIANEIDPQMPYVEENIATLQDLMPAPMLARLPWQPELSPHDLVPLLSPCLPLLAPAAGQSAD